MSRLFDEAESVWRPRDSDPTSLGLAITVTRPSRSHLYAWLLHDADVWYHLLTGVREAARLADAMRDASLLHSFGVQQAMVMDALVGLEQREHQTAGLLHSFQAALKPRQQAILALAQAHNPPHRPSPLVARLHIRPLLSDCLIGSSSAGSTRTSPLMHFNEPEILTLSRLHDEVWCCCSGRVVTSRMGSWNRVAFSCLVGFRVSRNACDTRPLRLLTSDPGGLEPAFLLLPGRVVNQLAVAVAVGRDEAEDRAPRKELWMAVQNGSIHVVDLIGLRIVEQLHTLSQTTSRPVRKTILAPSTLVDMTTLSGDETSGTDESHYLLVQLNEFSRRRTISTNPAPERTCPANFVVRMMLAGWRRPDDVVVVGVRSGEVWLLDANTRQVGVESMC
ncbi:unnamed protein product [Protopolystoma xenopodis]|uniref:Uncharacterized protein n=1 Tax=Protopolystoma xenopodis TaxID=117903 RepID=A0A3S5BW87_9PLAT|nr:unnamed protein product [Protopolystoma xenopodis]